MRLKPYLLIIILMLVNSQVNAQKNYPVFREDFTLEEFKQRRENVYDAIGSDAIALLQGAPNPLGYITFRQDNNFYYLSGVESPHAYMLLDGRRRRATLFLAHSNVDREAFEGKQLSADETEFVQKTTGIEGVSGTETLGVLLANFAHQPRSVKVYMQFAPAENYAASRDIVVRAFGDIAGDPWDGRSSRKAHFVTMVKKRFPQFQIEDLTPVIDRLRLIKSPREIEMVRNSTRLSGLALMESMRSTRPGLYEYELDALSKLIFYRYGAQGDAYYSLVSSGINAYVPHYNAKKSIMEDGEMLLMDYAPDIGYYVSDVTRMWPVNGTFSPDQREYYQFYLDFHTTVLESIRPGVTAGVIMKEAVKKMEKLLENTTFSKPLYAENAKKWVDEYRSSANRPNARLGHWLGMAAHDVGFDTGPLKPGMMFTIEPDRIIHEEKIYLSIEDVVLITETGAEIISDFIPKTIEDIEKMMREPGLLDVMDSSGNY
jgi:Xaa-Pro aminopeptidase